MLLKNTIFPLFGRGAKVNDILKDGDGKGTLERYNEALAEDFDDDQMTKLDNLALNVIDPNNALTAYLGYIEQAKGIDYHLGTSETARRRVIRHHGQWVKIKGTVRCYTLMFAMLGLDATITEDFEEYGFDSPLTFDDDRRRFDQNCRRCIRYTVELTGSLTMTPALVETIYNVIRFNEPIDAKLETLSYNGSYLVQYIISVELNDDGDLVYENEYDPFLVLSLVNGDLVVSGPMASHYSINGDGDLVFTI